MIGMSSKIQCFKNDFDEVNIRLLLNNNNNDN